MGRTDRRRKKRRKQLIKCFDFSDIYFLMKWLRLNKCCDSMRMSVHHFSSTGRGLIAKQRLTVGDLIVSIPYDFLISSQTVLADSDLPINRLYLPQFNSIQLLSAFLILEKKKRLNSKWFYYINSIPDNFDELPYFCDYNSLSQHIPQSIISLINSQYISFESSMKLVLTAINLEENEQNILAFKWAFAAVNTRSVYLQTKCNENDMALAPFLDLLNHSSNVKVNAAFNPNTNCYEIRALTACHKYDQVFINYGDHSNRKLFTYYGFCCKHNVNNTIHVTITHLSKLFKSINDRKKLEILLTNNVINLSNDFAISSEGFEWKLEMLLKLISMEKWQKPSIIKRMLYCGEVLLNNNEFKRYQNYKSQLIDILLNEYDIEYISILTNYDLKYLLFTEIELLNKYKNNVN